jgi:hypothetical protein
MCKEANFSRDPSVGEKDQVVLKVEKGNMNYKDSSSFIIQPHYDFDVTLTSKPMILFY